MGAAVKFKTNTVPRQQGERARFKVVRGPDYGAVYVLTDAKATIGRGEECDVVVSDLKASRKHAELGMTATGWQIKDLGSANGILINGKSAPSAILNARDTVSIGETVLEFAVAEQATQILVAPPRSIEKVSAEQSAFEAQRAKVRSLGNLKPGDFIPKAAPKAATPKLSDPNSKRLLLWGAVLAIGAFVFFGDDAKNTKPAKKKQEGDPTRDLGSYLPTTEPSIAKTADIFFRSGFREYRQGNYLRAKTQFETVLQMSPGHSLAHLYLQNSENRIKEEVKTHLELGKKSLDSGKLKEAKGHFEATLRLLYRNQVDPSFIEAKEQLDFTLKEMQKAEAMN